METAIIEKIVAQIQTKKLRPIVRINRGMLAEKVKGLTKSDIYTLYTRTEARLRKTSREDGSRRPWEKVFKMAVVNGMIQVDYESCVNLQREREDKPTDFEARARVWGQKVGGSLLTHTVDGEERKYISFNPRNCLSVAYEDNEGNEITKQQLESFEYPKSETRQDVDKEIIWRTYKVDSIIALAADGFIWQIVD